MLGLISGMYSGESMTFETNLTSPVYTVYGNSSDLVGLNVSFENGNITISTDPLFAPDNFTLIFFDNLTKEIIKEIHHGGSGSSTKYIKENVTVYVPEYLDKIVNNTQEIEVEKDIDKIVYKRDYSFSILLAILSSIILIIISQLISYFYYKKAIKSYSQM